MFKKKVKIVLLGDSILDNAPYVEAGESVSEIINNTTSCEALLLAVDGSVTTEVIDQLQQFPNKDTIAFVSGGGNDGLMAISILAEEVSYVKDALEKLHHMRVSFRKDYQKMLKAVLAKTKKVVVCTVYNKVPGLSTAEQTALALFNEVILEEAFAHQLPLIDLRQVCNKEEDYSSVSPIEPSFKGGQKIAKVIAHVATTHDFSKGVVVYQ